MTFKPGFRVKLSVMIFASLAMNIIITITGTATTPLITAVQNSALIGSMGVKFKASPSSVAAAITP